MSDDPQEAPKKFADEDPYGEEDTEGATAPGAGEGGVEPEDDDER